MKSITESFFIYFFHIKLGGWGGGGGHGLTLMHPPLSGYGYGTCMSKYIIL